MRSPKSIVFDILAAVFALVTAFFTFYGVLLVYTALTFEGEGSLGHVGMYIAAWRKAFRSSPGAPPPA
jgi:hypothetical protein